MRSQGIDFKFSAPRTQTQNGLAKRSKGVVARKARAIAIGSKLPTKLWKEIVNAAIYLHNRTPQESRDWKSPFEVFYRRKPLLSHLKVYGCHAYVMTEDVQEKKNRLRKLDSKIYIE